MSDGKDDAAHNISHNEAVDTTCCCATCGCDLEKYDECFEQIHWLEHKEVCGERAAELVRDELLFKQPESTHMGDCPICCLPLSLENSKSFMMACCCKVICQGCFYSNSMREDEMRMQRICPFCREPVISTEEGTDKQRMKRVEANDPAAMWQEGGKQYEKGNHVRALQYYTKAAELGHIDAHWQLAIMYHNGQGVEKDMGKGIHHLEEASIGGHPEARFNLGRHELANGNIEITLKHWVIAATQGHGVAIKALMEAFKKGFVDKGVLAAALRAHKAAVDATKSPQREAAEKIYRSTGVS